VTLVAYGYDLRVDGKRMGLLFRRSGDRARGKIRTAFEKAVERAGLKNFRFHDLRHTAASHMVMRGAQLREVQEILGHRTFAMTLRYSHLSTAHVRAAVDRLDGLTGSAPAADVTVEATPVGHMNGHTSVESGASAP
jgi:site-specific recombinase XerD